MSPYVTPQTHARHDHGSLLFVIYGARAVSQGWGAERVDLKCFPGRQRRSAMLCSCLLLGERGSEEKGREPDLFI